MIKFIKKYRHGLVIAIYALLYLITFNYLENRTVFSYQYHVIDTVFDSYIPFCEYFIVPYLLWFPYMIMTIWYFIFKNNNKKEYYLGDRHLRGAWAWIHRQGADRPFTPSSALGHY